MGGSLIESLQNIRDFRAVHGRRYPLWLIMLLVIMGIMSGCRSYYALFRLWSTSLRSIMREVRVNSESATLRHDVSAGPTKIRFCAVLAQQFEQWAKDNVEMEPGEWIAIDGKSIKSTVSKSDAPYQNFVSMVCCL